MTLYRKYAQGETVKGEFNLTSSNIELYHSMSKQMDEEVRWIRTLIGLRNKRDRPEDNQDSLYTPEYIERRLAKIEAMREITPEIAEVIKISQELDQIERDMTVLSTIVLDKELGKDPAQHEKMSLLSDRFNILEEQRNDIYTKKYPLLKAHLPKIYYMILEGVDMDTINSCFIKMKSVLLGKLTTEEAASKLMEESETKYNLPKTLYDPIRNNRRTGAKK